MKTYKIKSNINVLTENMRILNHISSRNSYSKIWPEAPMLFEVTEKLNIEITDRISEILNDERMSYKTATIFENAPLALIQLQMETELHTLQKIIGEPLTNVKKLRKEQPHDQDSRNTK